jgi:hypothetical protein
MFIENKYSKCYYNIINRAKSRELSPNTYTEKHHIIPKSCGGDNSSANLVKLTAREHYICHLLLPKMLTGVLHHKLVHAAWRMCNSLKDGYKVTGRTYAKIREQHSWIMSEIGHDGQFKMGRPTWNKGIPRTPEEKKKMSQSRIGVKTGRTKDDFTSEWKAKISAAAKERNTGEKNPMFGKTHNEATRAKLSATRKAKAGTPGWNVRPPCSDEKANKIKLANMGKRWVHNKETKERKYIDPLLVADYVNTGWELGLGPKF